MRANLKVVHFVDDNVSFRKAIEALLTRYGFKVLTYPSAEHLLDQLPSDVVPGCIILDVHLGSGMSGPDLQDRLIELGVTLPIIFLTGYEDIPTTVRTLKAGGEDFLVKPVEAEHLLSAHRPGDGPAGHRAGSAAKATGKAGVAGQVDGASTAGVRPCRSWQDA